MKFIKLIVMGVGRINERNKTYCDEGGKRINENDKSYCDGGERERERNVLFNHALNTFYLQFYGVRHMVKDHSDSEKGNPLPPHRLLLSINSKGSFICSIPQTG